MASELFDVVNSTGGHYSVHKVKKPFEFLREVFPEGKANEMNLCLFSTSGVHGTYQTLEDEENDPQGGVTFLVIQPRRVALFYGEVSPKTEDDFKYLKKLRNSSKRMVQRMG
jgi:hypothetical protein